MTAHRRLDSLEGLRFLSSLIIVAGHYVPYVVDTPLITRTHMAVDLFFVISGIVIAETYRGRIGDGRDYLRFVGRRFARLYPLHLATLGFYVGIGALYWLGLSTPNDAARYAPAAIVPNLLLVHAWLPDGVMSFNYVSWSISAEFFVYLLFPVLAFGLRRPAAGGIVVLMLLLVATLLSQHLLGRPLTRLSWDFGVLRALPSFAFGVWVSAAAPGLGRHLPFARLRWLVPASLAVTGLLFVVAIDQTVTLLVIWAAVALAFMADRAGMATPVSRPALARRGALTYSIYMLHTVVATVLMAALLPRLLGSSLPARLAALTISLVVLYALATVSLRWFEQPLRARINQAADRILRFAGEPPRHLAGAPLSRLDS